MGKFAPNKVEKVINHLQSTSKLNEFIEFIQGIDKTNPELKLFEVFTNRGGYNCPVIPITKLAEKLNASQGWIKYREDRLIVKYYDFCTQLNIPPVDIL